MRGAILVLGALGLSMCAFGASPSAYATPGALTAIASLLDTGALILVVPVFITGARPVVALLTADSLALWALTTVRHFSAATSPA